MSEENALFPQVKDAIAFEALWQQACEKITALSGKIWTDTGEHDPGITLLQAVTWNCSDLSYRASLPLNDLLTQKNQTPLFPAEFGPDRILTCNTVTAEDYRRALLDLHSRDIPLDTSDQDFLFSDVCLIKEPEKSRYHWWYDADKRIYSFNKPGDGGNAERLTLRGNLWLSVVATRYTQSLLPENRAKVEQYLTKFIEEHRNLGEKISRVTWLQPATFSPRITIELSADVFDVNQVAAQIYQVTETFLRPAITRYTPEQRRRLGDLNENIFEGPRLQHGWQQTVPSRILSGGYRLNLGPLVNLLLAVPGVDSLSTLSVNAEDRHITAVKGNTWCWQVAEGYYPLLWGETPLVMLAGAGGPLKLMAKGGIRSPLDSQKMAGCLTKETLTEMAPVVLAAGRFRDQTPYVPAGRRLPECYALQQPDSLTDASVRALHQFLLIADQLIADGTAELAQLPKLLAFTERGNFIRGTRWPYAEAGTQQKIHHAYAEKLKDIMQRDAAVFSEQDNQPHRENFSRELDFLQYLLSYFGTQRADLPLIADMADFLATQRMYLAQQPTLGYDRINIQTDRVSALQKRMAARIGLGSSCFDDEPDLSQLPFYLIEHRKLLPQRPDSVFDTEHTPSKFSPDVPHITLTQAGSAGRIVQGQLLDLIAIEGSHRLYVRRLMVIALSGDSFTVSTENSQQLYNNLSRLQDAWKHKNLRWQNSSEWLQDMHYRLTYAEAALQPSNKRQRLLKSNAQSPYPSVACAGDVITLRPTKLQFSFFASDGESYDAVNHDWQLEATIKAVDPIAGTILIEKVDGSKNSFPADKNSFHYQWFFSKSSHAQMDRFSLRVSAVLNHRLIKSQNIVPDRLVSWLHKSIITELPAHIALVIHWLDEASFKNFGATYARWQNNGMSLGDDAFTLLQILTLGCIPVTQLDIGLMRIATKAQHVQVAGSDGSNFNREVILREELFYVPQNTPLTYRSDD